MIKSYYFSIIISTYNRSDLILKTIASIYDQEFTDFELIVVDDGSTDNTEQIVKQIGHLTLKYIRISNVERGAARNLGFTNASGKYINYFDSDDLFLPCLKDLKKFLENNDRPAVVYGTIKHMNTLTSAEEVKPPPFKSFTKNLVHNNFLACGSVFLRRDVAFNFRFHEHRRLSSAEDWELWLRVHADYAFLKFNQDVFCQVNHSTRSLQTINAKRIEERDLYFIECIKKNTRVVEYYGSLADLFIADRYTFIALAYTHLNKAKAFNYWYRALMQSYRVIYRKRFWAVFRKFVLNT